MTWNNDMASAPRLTELESRLAAALIATRQAFCEVEFADSAKLDAYNLGSAALIAAQAKATTPPKEPDNE